jgi:hypothetical protein
MGSIRDCISLAHLSSEFGSSGTGRKSKVDADLELSFLCPSLCGASELRLRKLREAGGDGSSRRKLTTRVGCISDFFFCREDAMSPI